MKKRALVKKRASVGDSKTDYYVNPVKILETLKILA
jgi:hypothetical protein